MKKNLCCFMLVFFLINIVNGYSQAIDVASMLNKYNVSWDSPGTSAYQSMPIGNGDIGLNVWTEANGDLAFYISKTDAWGEETKQRGPWMAQGGVLMKLGLVHISITPNLFKQGDYFRQLLKLHDGEMVITEGVGKNAIQLKVWVDANNPVIHIESKSTQGVTLNIKLDDWRTNGNGDTILNKAGNIEWYHKNSPNADAHIKDIIFGASITGKGFSNINTTTLRSVPDVDQNISIYPYTKKTGQVNDWLKELNAQITGIDKINIETAKKAHQKWWDAFWHRSWIFVDGDSAANKVTQGYVLQRFVTACAGRGLYPIKFNGSIFTVDNPDYKQDGKSIAMDADFREWGGQYWFQNTRAMYWPRLMAGDFDMMMPLFKMYANILPANQQQVKQYYNHAGAYFAETSPFWGGLLYMGPEVKEIWTGHYFTPILELSMMMLDYFEYTGDTAFAKNILLPIASNGILFFDKHFGRDPSGKLLLDPDNSIEMFWKVYNPAPDIAGLHAVIQRLIDLPKSITNDSLRNEWKRFQLELPDLPTGIKNNKQVLLPYTGPQTVISHNFENPELYSIYPFRLYGLGKPGLQLAQNSFNERRCKNKGCWFQDPIQAAMLGYGDIAKEYVAFNFSNKDPHLKFPAFWDKEADYMPDEDNGGNGENGLQEMLMQVDGKKIMLLPAWPKGWNANFKLNAPYKTTISGKVENGKLVSLTVFPLSRKADIVF